MRTIGRYEIVRKVGTGGMASVYLARQLDLDRLVALKELRTPEPRDPSFARRFLREARLAGSLNHPNIVTVHDYFEESGLPYIAMEYLERGSLRRTMNGFTLAQIGGVLQGVLAGLAHAELQGIVHRDIKPENLLVTVEGGVKIADFGIAKATNAVEAGSLVTRTGLTVGTPNYIAPEQALAHELGPWTDLYSVGITAFEMLTGRTPFGDTAEPMAIVLRQINEPIRRVIDVVPQVPAWMSDWVSWLVAKDPAQRPQSAARAWDALESPLIATIGPRWARDASLRSPPGEEPTRRAADPRLAPTVPPRTARRTRTTVPATSRARRVPTWLKATAGVATLLATAAVALAGHSGGTSPELVPSADSPLVQAPRKAARPAPSTPSPAPSTSTSAGTGTTGTGTTSTGTTSTGTTSTGLAARVAPAQKLARKYDAMAAQIAETPNGEPKSVAAAVAALRAAAQAYREAGAAAARNDAAGYNAAISAATGAKRVSSTLTVTAPRTTTKTPAPAPPPARVAPPHPAVTTAPAVTTTPSDSGASDSGSSNGGPCAGDSTSDDPSDDDCSGEP